MVTFTAMRMQLCFCVCALGCYTVMDLATFLPFNVFLFLAIRYA